MLKYTVNSIGVKFELVKKSESYDVDKNQQVIDNIITNTASCLKNATDGSAQLVKQHEQREEPKVKIDPLTNLPIFQLNSHVVSSTLTRSDVDLFLRDNPLGLFNECIAQYCPFSRVHYPQFRNVYDKLFTHFIGQFKSTFQNPLYVSFGSGGYFQDIVNLSVMIKQGIKHFNVILIDDLLDYIECITNPQKNTLATSNMVSFEMSDDRKDREIWCSLKTYRLIKFLEIFEDYIDHVTLLRSPAEYIDLCSNDPSYKADIISAIDYVDEMTLSSPIEYQKMYNNCSKIGCLIVDVYKDIEMKIHASIHQKILDDSSPERETNTKPEKIKTLFHADSVNQQLFQVFKLVTSTRIKPLWDLVKYPLMVAGCLCFIVYTILNKY
jgi:hypothetical protein